MPELRPDARITAKRCRHALRAILPALARLGIEVEIDPDDPMATAPRVCTRGLRRRRRRASGARLQLTGDPGVARARRVHVHPRASVLRDDLRADRRAARRRGRRAQPRRRRDARRGELAAAEAIAGRVVGVLVADRRRCSPRPSCAFASSPTAPARSSRAATSASRAAAAGRTPSASTPRPTSSVPEVRERVIAGQPNIDAALDTAIESGLLTPTGTAQSPPPWTPSRPRSSSGARPTTASRCGCSASAAARAAARASAYLEEVRDDPAVRRELPLRLRPPSADACPAQSRQPTHA